MVTLEHLRRALRERPQPNLGDAERAAVALILQERHNQPEVLIIQRALQPRDPWSGHLAFPGGHHSTTDESLLHTAMRETQEEIGLDLERCAALLGPLDALRAPNRGSRQLTVAPFVFELEPDTPLALELDPREVQTHFWVPLHPLERGEQQATMRVDSGAMRMDFPGYRVGEGVLWGMSYRMLQSLFASCRSEDAPLP